MGDHRDELSLHERSLDVLVGLLKEESYIPFSACCYAPCGLIFEAMKLCTSVYILLYLHFTKSCEIDFTKDKQYQSLLICSTSLSCINRMISYIVVPIVSKYTDLASTKMQLYITS